MSNIQLGQAGSSKVRLDQLSDRLVDIKVLEEKERLINECAQSMINSLYVSIRSVSLYDQHNASIDNAYDRLVEAVRSYVSYTQLTPTLRIHNSNVLVNEQLIKLNSSTYKNLRTLTRIFEHLEVDELVLESKLTRADVAQFINELLSLMDQEEASYETRRDRLIYLRKSESVEDHELLQSKHLRDQVLVWYATALIDVTEYCELISHHTKPNFKQLKRLAQSLIEMPPAAEPLLINLHLITPTQERGSLVSSAISAACHLSIIFKQLKLERNQSVNLCISALQMYSGLLMVEETGLSLDAQGQRALEVIQELSPNRKLAQCRHQVAKRTLDLGGVSEALLQRLIIAYELIHSQERPSEWMKTTPSRAQLKRQLYPRGFTQGYYTTLMHAAFLYVLSKTSQLKAPLEQLKDSGVSEELTLLFTKVFGSLPVGTGVRMSDGRAALITQTYNGEPRSLLLAHEDGEVYEPAELISVEPDEVLARCADLPEPLVRSVIFSM